MTVGRAVADAHALLNLYRGTNATAPAGIFVKLHTGDPGANGTANAAAVTDRNQATFNAPSNGSMTLNTLAAYAMTASETISHISLWDASSGGTFRMSLALTASKTVSSGDTLTITVLTLSVTPVAA